MTTQRIPIPPLGMEALRSLEREASNAEHGAAEAADNAVLARMRADAVRNALCEALGAPKGAVKLDFAEGCFVVSTPDATAEKLPGK